MQPQIEAAKRMVVEGRDVPWLLRTQAERYPDKPFLIWEPFSGQAGHWTYAEFLRDVEAVAATLHRLGVAAGQHVLLHMDNSPEFMLTWFACARIGAVVVSTNTASVARDIAYFAEHAEVACALTQPAYADLVHASAPSIEHLIVADNNAGEVADAPGVSFIPFGELLTEGGESPTRPVEPSANLGIQYTSGTTSRPKAVLWTQANAIWGAQVNALHMALTHEDIALVFLPLFHTNAQSYSMLGTLWAGGTMVLQPKFSASRFWSVARRNRCTWTSMIPFCINALQQYAIPDDHQFRFWGTAVRLPAVDDAFAVRTVGWWGMTETITHGTVTDTHHPGGLMSIGRSSVAYDISIRRPDGTSIGPGERGRLYIRGIRGVSLFKEYYKNPQATSESFDADGWFDTGDLVRMDESGDLYFSDRDKDMLKVGGENVAASEVEAVILETGWVGEVAVVGQKHYMLDEVPVAFVIAKPDAPKNLADRLIEHCKAELPVFKALRDVHVVDDLPRAMLQKVAKQVLREQLPTIEA